MSANRRFGPETAVPITPLFTFDAQRARDEIVKFIGLESLVFRFCDSLDFEEAMKKSYQSHAKRILRTTLTR